MRAGVPHCAHAVHTAPGPSARNTSLMMSSFHRERFCTAIHQPALEVVDFAIMVLGLARCRNELPDTHRRW